ncbi:HAMP domain-containing protein [Acidipila sp. EB88]|nr:HAMP domain-containing protein [Acidipila sp. EB88]
MSLFQRLLLGGLLLLALVTGLSFLVRGTFVSLSALAQEQKAIDHAVSGLAAAQASLAREQILVERSLLHLADPQGITSHSTNPAATPQESEIRDQGERAEDRLLNARIALADLRSTPGADSGAPIEIDREIAQHHRVLLRLHHTPPTAEARTLSARELEPIDEALSSHLRTMLDRRAALLNDLALRRETLSARLIGACAASILTALCILVGMLFFTMQPLRAAARTARRMGQGDLQQRIVWSRSDELGTLATEFNRLAIRLRDLRETESGRREMELQLSDAVVQSIFEPVIVTDGRGQLLRVNNAARELLGAAASDRMALTSTPGGAQILGAIQTAITLQRTVNSEADSAMAPMRIGEAQKNFRLRTTPMRDNEGHLLGAVTVLEDVTELQALDRFKSGFLAVASQKLRDPLEKLRLAIHALGRGYAGDLRPLQADVLEGARTEAEHLDDLMADLFAVAELDSGRRSLRLEPLRPIDVLREAQSNVRAAAADRGISIEVEAYADLQRVEADRRALRSIFENLLSNAIRNTPSGGYIRLAATESKRVVHFRIEDTGRGIEPERLNMIFGRFTSGSSEGTGLGLALVRRLVESQGGQISVVSQLGTGTTFTFTLPVATNIALRHPVEAG